MAPFVILIKMLYMIGGPPRMGKSTLAQKLLAEQSLPYVSTDALTVMLKPLGEPSFYSPEKSARLFPLLELFIMRMLKSSPNYVIEGDAFSPHHVSELQNKYDVKAVFLTMSKVSTDAVIRFAQFDNWASEDTPKQLEDLAARIVAASEVIKEECEHFSIPHFDLSSDYATNFERAYKLLVDN